MTRKAASSLIATTLAVVAMLWLGTIRTYSAATLLPPGEQCFQSTSPTSGGLYGPLVSLGTITGGSGYTNNVYTNVPLTGGSGFGATANITVAGGAVVNVTIINPGTHYAPADVLSAATANLGGAGSSFSVPVASVSTTGTGLLGLLGAITGGSGGVAGTYPGVALTGGSGSGAAANITVAGGAVTAVAITAPGLQYQVGDILSAASGSIGGTTGFSVPVSSVTVNSALAGGRVFMYVPNTVTFKQTWKNAAQTILNTNPITLDQNGCTIIYGIGTYRQVVQDSLGNTVWDQLTTDTSAQQNVFWAGIAGGGPNAITLIDPGFNATDGSIINFTASSTNTGITTINPSGFGNITILKDTGTGPQTLVGGEIIANNPISVIYRLSDASFHILNLIASVALPNSVKTFGAVGNSNGTHLNGNDDTTAIKNALSSTNNNFAYFPCGTYRITAAMLFDTASSSKSYRLKGDGACSQLYLDTTVGTTMLNFTNVTCCCVGCITIKDLNFIAPNFVTGSAAVGLTNEQMILFENNFATGWAALISLTTSYGPRIVGNTIQTMPGGLFSPTAGGDQSFNNLVLWRNRLAALGITNNVSAVNLNCNGATQLSILGNDIEVSNAGIQFQSCNSVVLEGNYMDVNTIYHIQFQGSNSGYTIRNNWFGSQAGQAWTNISKSVWGGNTFATVAGVGFGSTALGTIVEPTNIIPGGGHLTGLPTPTLSSCGGGTPTIVGTRFAGVVTEGTTATGCTVTFELPFDISPACQVTGTTGFPVALGPSLTTNFTVTNASTSGGVFTYSCQETSQ